MFSQTSHENDGSNEKYLESFANLKLKKTQRSKSKRQNAKFIDIGAASFPRINRSNFVVEEIPLTQDNEEMVNDSFVEINNAEESLDYPELLNDILDKIVVVSNEEFVKLYFEWNVYFLHEN